LAGLHSSPDVVRFGPFELDQTVGELRKGEARIRLQEQPFHVLQILLSALASWFREKNCNGVSGLPTPSSISIMASTIPSSVCGKLWGTLPRRHATSKLCPDAAI